MQQTSTDDRPKILPRRLRAIVALRPGGSIRSLAAADLGGRWTDFHVSQVGDGQRVPSRALLEALRAALTATEWAYLTGASDELPTERRAA